MATVGQHGRGWPEASTNEISEWRAQARVCSSNHFGRYFSYSILSDQFSDAEIHEASKLTGDIKKFENLILNYSKEISKHEKSRIPDFLERFLDILRANQANDHLQDIVKDFLVLGDLVVREEDVDRSSGLMGIDTDMRIMWIIHAALQRLPEDQVFNTIKEALENTKSIHIPIRLIIYLGKEHGLYGKEKKEPGAPCRRQWRPSGWRWPPEAARR